MFKINKGPAQLWSASSTVVKLLIIAFSWIINGSFDPVPFQAREILPKMGFTSSPQLHYNPQWVRTVGKNTAAHHIGLEKKKRLRSCKKKKKLAFHEFSLENYPQTCLSFSLSLCPHSKHTHWNNLDTVSTEALLTCFISPGPWDPN